MIKPFWQFRNAEADPSAGELYLYGFIGKDDGLGWLFDEISPKAFKADLDALGDISALKVFVNSEGGDVFAGQAIHSMLKRHKAYVTMFVDGLAASMASVVVMAGDTVVMPRNAMMMVHNPWTIAIGDSDEFRKVAETLDQVRESIIAAYQEKTGMAHSEILSLLQEETWMTASEAVELGFADRVDDAHPIAAAMVSDSQMLINGRAIDINRFANPPQFAFTRDPLYNDAIHDYERSFSKQADELHKAILAFESRTLTRLASRQNAGRRPSASDMEHWQKVRGAAERVLAQSESQSPGQTDVESTYIEFLEIMSR